MRGLALISILALTSVARADDPKFEFGKKEEPPKAVEWKASAQGGLVLTTGNSNSTTISGGAAASRKEGGNKLQLELGGAYARSELEIAVDLDANGRISPGEITREQQTTTKNIAGKIRYDRFFTEHNSLFATARAAVDEPSGKELVAGGQLGYSRQVVKSKIHEVVAEGGYDFAYERYVGDTDPQSVSIHSLRIFASHTATLSDTTTVATSIESLFNLNEENTPTGVADPLEDTRVVAKTAVTTKLGDSISLRFAFGARFDHFPAPRPPIGGIPFEGTVLAEKLDTTTEFAVIINFL